MCAAPRRALALLLVLALNLGLLAACGRKNEPEPPGGPEKAIGIRPYPRS
jgi:hypothetical protein